MASQLLQEIEFVELHCQTLCVPVDRALVPLSAKVRVETMVAVLHSVRSQAPQNLHDVPKTK